MNIWQDTVKQAILGSQRSEHVLPLAVPELQSRQQHWQHLSREQQVLNALALVAAYHGAGQTGYANRAIVPTAAASETETYCSKPVQQLLQRYLHEENHGLLKEALALLSTHRQLLPPDSLADFLAWAITHRADAAQVRNVIGQRGLWLCALNPDWQALSGGTDDSDGVAWLNAHGAVRGSLFADALATDWALTFERLQQQWPLENAKDKQVLLEALASQPAAELLPFLQAIQHDRSLAVRWQTTKLMAKLQDPDTMSLLLQTLASILTVQKPLLGKRQLAVHLPETLSEIWQKRGLQEKLDYLPDTQERIGNKAGWLYQWLGLANPASLGRQLDLGLPTLLAAAKRCDFAAVLLNGLDAGAALHGCTDFLAPRFAGLELNEQLLWLQKMALAFPLPCLEPLFIKHFRQLKPSDAGAAIYVFIGHQDYLSSTFISATHLIDNLLATFSAETAINTYERKWLAQLGFKLPLADFDRFSQRLRQTDSHHFIELLANFSQRHALHQEFP